MAGERAVQNTDSYKATMQEGRMNMLRRSVGMGENGQLTPRGLQKLRKAEAKEGARLKMYASQLANVRKDDEIKEGSRSTLMNTASRTEIPKTTMGYTDDSGNDVAVSTTDFFKDGTREAYYARQFLTAAEAKDTTAMNAAIAAAQAAGMKDKDIAKMVRQANDKGHIKLDQNTKRAWAQDLAAKYGNGFLATDFELKH